MAISLEQPKKGMNWFTAAIVLVVIAALGLTVYFLFFASPPAIKVLIPPALETAAEISKVQFDPASVVNSAAFRSLRSYVDVVSVGSLGRDNPFISY